MSCISLSLVLNTNTSHQTRGFDDRREPFLVVVSLAMVFGHVQCWDLFCAFESATYARLAGECEEPFQSTFSSSKKYEMC